MEKLSHLIHDVVDSKTLHYLKFGNRDHGISHLMFADNLILFNVATQDQFKLSKLCDSSGKKINRDKSSIMFSGNTPLSTIRLLIA
ncbi:unnamed protein product [Lathyrus oleraceus]